MSHRAARSLRIDIIEADRFVLLHAEGTIDAITAPALRAALDRFRRQSQRLILDLREVASIERAGLDLLLAVAQELHAVGGQLRVITQPGGAVERTLRLAGLDRRLLIFHTAPEALAGRPRPE